MISHNGRFKAVEMRVRKIIAKNVREVQRGVDRAIDEGFVPTLALCFASVACGIDAISNLFDEYKSIDLYGMSSAGEILIDREETSVGESVIHNESIVIALLDLPKSCYHLQLFPFKEDAKSLGSKIVEVGGERFENPKYIVGGCHIALNGAELTEGVIESDSSVVVCGGLAGDDSDFNRTFVFTQRDVLDMGAIALILDGDRVATEEFLTSGWREVGDAQVVTSSDSNIVYTIDYKRAYDVYTSFFDLSDEDMPLGAVQHPLLFAQHDGSYTLRAVLGADQESGTLIFAGSVPEGERVKMSTSMGHDALSKSVKEINAHDNKIDQADCLLVFSCMARHMAFGDMVAEEIEAAYSKWQAPAIGMFTYGEIGPNSLGNCAFHNEALSLIALKEL
jgi:hypothetical protein